LARREWAAACSRNTAAAKRRRRSVRPEALKLGGFLAYPTGAFTIYAFGEITCREVFNNSWTSHFRFMYGGQGGEKPKGANGQKKRPRRAKRAEAVYPRLALGAREPRAVQT
jgi:hypothetical protein